MCHAVEQLLTCDKISKLYNELNYNIIEVIDVCYCTGIAEVTGSRPVEAQCFQAFLSQLSK